MAKAMELFRLAVSNCSNPTGGLSGPGELIRFFGSKFLLINILILILVVLASALNIVLIFPALFVFLAIQSGIQNEMLCMLNSPTSYKRIFKNGFARWSNVIKWMFFTGALLLLPCLLYSSGGGLIATIMLIFLLPFIMFVQTSISIDSPETGIVDHIKKGGTALRKYFGETIWIAIVLALLCWLVAEVLNGSFNESFAEFDRTTHFSQRTQKMSGIVKVLFFSPLLFVEKFFMIISNYFVLLYCDTFEIHHCTSSTEGE